MGLAPGTTEVAGLSRRQRLALLGNGVVPQQAAAAFEALLAEFSRFPTDGGAFPATTQEIDRD